MTKLYGVSIINKHDVWLREDEENPNNWIMMSKEKLEQHLQRKMTSIEKVLLKNNYVAPLKKIYKEIVQYRTLTGQTPFKTIQERV
ncbi:MAG: hypothetical protein HYY41_06865 [Chloroflexi bacterium]|nr:hypothetical protein [Chloroflexota bacterium]